MSHEEEIDQVKSVSVWTTRDFYFTAHWSLWLDILWGIGNKSVQVLVDVQYRLLLLFHFHLVSSTYDNNIYLEHFFLLTLQHQIIYGKNLKEIRQNKWKKEADNVKIEEFYKRFLTEPTLFSQVCVVYGFLKGLCS